MNEIETLNKWIQECNHIVFFGGAGVSTESGIPDFRSVDGLYNQKYKYPPETILSSTFFFSKMNDFYDFYKDKMLCLDAKPSYPHTFLKELEAVHKLDAIVTQNIDGLHQAAGSSHVYELHGSVHRNYCLKCHKEYDANYIKNTNGIPKCNCGGIIKPDVVLYEEGLDEKTIMKSVDALRNADMVIVAGTSLNVYPAASFINYYHGDKLVLINLAPTPFDAKANLVIHDKISNVFKQIKL